MDQASASPAASCVGNPARRRTSSSGPRSAGRSRTAAPPPARSDPQGEPHAEPSNNRPRSSSPALCRLKAKRLSAAGFLLRRDRKPGRFSEGLLLRRLQPWSFSEEAAAEKHMAQLQHNMWVTNSRLAALSVITGGGKWVEIKISADPLYQHLLLTAEKKFWRCVENGEPPRLFGVEPPQARIEAVRIVEMSSSNGWAEFSNVFRRTREAYLEHENAKAEPKGLSPK